MKGNGGSGPETLAKVRAWRAHLVRFPLHDAHVKAFKALTKGMQWKRFDCPACGKEAWPLNRPRDASGVFLKHCGCRTSKTRHCHLCGCEYTVNAPRQMHCKKCRPRAQQLLRNKQKMLDRWKPGAAVRLHDGHVKQWLRLIDEESRRIEVANRRLHDAHVNDWKSSEARVYRWRYKYDEEFRIKERLRRQLRKKAHIESIEAAVRASIHGKKSGSAIEQLLGYSMTDLKVHLERQFQGGMNWKSYGRKGWHIDHIKPKRCFDLTRMDEVRAFWSLPNLRPLPARENLKKNQHVYHLL